MLEVFPKKNYFLKSVKKKENQVIWAKVKSDLDTPVSVYLKLCSGLKNTFLLESVQDGTYRGRYSIVGLKPDIIWKCKNGIAYKKIIKKKSKTNFTKEVIPPLVSLKNLINDSKINIPKNLPPMSAGLVGYLGYETIELYEKMPLRKHEELNMPDGFFIRPTVMVIFDGIKNEIIFICPYWFSNQNNFSKDYDEITKNIKNLIGLINKLPKNYTFKKNNKKMLKPKSNMSKKRFFKMVETAKKIYF